MLNAMRKVLIVAYHFPPCGEVGALRTLKFTHYLPAYGFLPVVLTVANRSVGVQDETLLREVPSGVKVLSTFSAEHRAFRAPRLLGINLKWFFLPDMHVGWLPFAVRRGEAVIREEQIDVIVATAPVFTSHLVGHFLARKTGIPLVLDFRDPWTQNAFSVYPTRWHRIVEEWMERTVLCSADFVVTTTEEMRRGLLRKYPFLNGRCETIPNGFDSNDYIGLKKPLSSGYFTIVYTGNFYGLRTADHFLEALKGLVGRHRYLRNAIRVVFAGPRDDRTIRLVHRLGLTDVVELRGFVSHRESLELMLGADVLLLVMSEREMGEASETVMIPAKTYEYLGARKTILALVPEGAVADMVRKTGSGVVIRPEDQGGIEAAILHLYERWRAGTLEVPACDISKFERRVLTARLAAILTAVSRRPTPPSSSRTASVASETGDGEFRSGGHAL